MVKQEIKIEYTNSENIKTLIEKAYFEEGDRGRIVNKNNYLELTPNDELFESLKDLNNAVVKITNDILDGSMRFVIEETENSIKLFPISIYCVKENETYSFY